MGISHSTYTQTNLKTSGTNTNATEMLLRERSAAASVDKCQKRYEQKTKLNELEHTMNIQQTQTFSTSSNCPAR